MPPLMLIAAMVADPAAPTADSGLAALAPLAGCWRVAGQVRGKPSPSIAQGQWHLGRRYFTLQLRAIGNGEDYEAAITYGAGEKPGAIGSIWHDTFGGLYEPSLGRGEKTMDGFVQVYRFPDANYVNRFVRDHAGWRWTIHETAAGKPDTLFASYQLRPSSCRGLRFTF